MAIEMELGYSNNEVQVIKNCPFYLFVGSEEEAAHAYDIEAIGYRGINASNQL